MGAFSIAGWIALRIVCLMRSRTGRSLKDSSLTIYVEIVAVLTLATLSR